jgi:hypothetical protein
MKEVNKHLSSLKNYQIISKDYSPLMSVLLSKEFPPPLETKKKLPLTEIFYLGKKHVKTRGARHDLKRLTSLMHR